ncbi:uncharacterized protein TNCV_669481 [Trichonephila clavipes]|nr:uncharacterized protein TNCV_669481 [Trichonephila clavipes]
MEIRTGGSYSNSSRQKSSSFDRVQQRSNELQYGKKKGSDVKHELEEKGLSFKNVQGERHTNKTNKRGPLNRSIPSSWSEKSRRIKRSKKEIIGKKRRTQDKVAVSTNRYNFRPRGGREVESRLAMEMKTQQGGPVRSRQGRGRKDKPYIEERTRSGNRKAKRRDDQQREDQERKGVSTRRSLSLEVLLGNTNYKS